MVKTDRQARGQEPLPPRPWRSEAERRVEERLQEIHESVAEMYAEKGGKR